MNFRAVSRLLVLLCALCGFAGNVFAQTNETLTQQIRSGNSEQKRSALFEIRNRQSEEASRIALPALKDSDEIVRATAAFSVIYLPKTEAFGALIPNLSDKSEIVRRETAYALGKIQNSAAIAPLIQTFQNKKEKSIEVKNAGIVALGEIGDASAIDALSEILRQKPKDDNDFLRRSAARSIGQIAQIIQIKESYTVTPESFLPEKFKFFTIEKYQNLAVKFSQFRAVLPVLTQVLQNPKESDDAKREAAFALGALGDASAVSILQNNLNSKDYYLAEICKESLKKLSSVNAAE
ncbi:MAG TPA: HEAT repeat domain-containing protein [Pyrinomonadaceae bacterium]|nr:HEAT repeat domain-containing protein [Pyrinomonadaceae bacterium]